MRKPRYAVFRGSLQAVLSPSDFKLLVFAFNGLVSNNIPFFASYLMLTNKICSADHYQHSSLFAQIEEIRKRLVNREQTKDRHEMKIFSGIRNLNPFC